MVCSVGATSLSVMRSHGCFACNFAGRFVVAQTAKAWMPQLAITGPLRKGEFADQRRRDPGRVIFCGPVGERRYLSNQFVHKPAQLQARLYGETGPHLPRVSQSTVLVVANQ